MTSTKRKASILALGLLAVLAVVGVGYAAIPSADGVIHACYNAQREPVRPATRHRHRGGQASAPRTRSALNFNQTGPQGPQGIQGIQGIQGDTV